jgi:hypothetical protein
MSSGPTERGLQIVLIVLGLVALFFGGLAVVTGPGFLPGVDRVPVNLDSEFRFYSAWYAGAGALILRSARDLRAEARTIRLICAVLLVGAVGRAISIVAIGRPDTVFVVLMGIEFLIPAIVLPWLARATRPTA